MAQGTSNRLGGSSIITWLERNDATVIANSPHGRVAWKRYLIKNAGITSDSVSDLERQWLRVRITALGGTVPTNGTINDLWGVYLSKKGFTGSIGDKFRQWLDHGTP